MTVKTPDAQIKSLRSAIKEAVSTAEVAELMQEMLFEAMRASRDVYASCRKCGTRTPVAVPDLATRLKAMQALIEEVEGKQAVQAAPKTVSRKITNMDELSDEELEALLSQEVSDGEVDGGSA